MAFNFLVKLSPILLVPFLQMAESVVDGSADSFNKQRGKQ